MPLVSFGTYGTYMAKLLVTGMSFLTVFLEGTPIQEPSNTNLNVDVQSIADCSAFTTTGMCADGVGGTEPCSPLADGSCACKNGLTPPANGVCTSMFLYWLSSKYMLFITPLHK